MVVGDNKNLSEGIANGTICKFVGLKLKKNETLHPKVWERYKVNTVSVSSVDYILLEHWKSCDKTKSRYFKLKPVVRSANIKLRLGKREIGFKTKIEQFSVLCNIATTGHKLQGMSKDSLIITDWNYQQNWIYVVLSRVRKLSGLYIRKDLLLKGITKADDKLIKEEKRLLKFEERLLQCRKANGHVRDYS